MGPELIVLDCPRPVRLIGFDLSAADKHIMRGGAGHHKNSVNHCPAIR